MDKIVVPDLPVSCFIGVPDRERAAAQEVFVDLELFLNLSPAGRSDDFSKTVDYDAVCGTVIAAAQARPRKLIESLAEDIASALMKQYVCSRVRVRVRKPAALKKRGAPYAAVEIERVRDA